jgi:trehalose 6-phosphate phosphatase
MSRSVPLRGDLHRVLDQLQRASHVLIALDFDGTLAPIVAHPEEAQLPPETVRVLERIAASDRHTLAIVSGRSLADLRRRVPSAAICAGNHGLEIEGEGFSFVDPAADLLRETVDRACLDLNAAIAGLPGVFLERKGLTATVHYRGAEPAIAGALRETIALAIAPYATLRVRPAILAWEILPRTGWSKGSAVRLLAGAMRITGLQLVCAGDDGTDEDMFTVRPDAVSIRVGQPRATSARYSVESPAELARFLELLAPGSRVRSPQVAEVLGQRM